MKLRIILLFILLTSLPEVYSQQYAIKTNLLYDFAAFTPNLGFEVGLSEKSTIDLNAGYNPWNLNTGRNGNKKLVHWIAEAEYKYWFCRRFAGHYISAKALGGKYNISKYNLPLLFGKDSKQYRFQGFAAGGGINYGYQFYLGKRWNLETSIGFGYIRLNYDKYNCAECGVIVGKEKRNYVGPTEAAVSLIYLIK
ncbi:MAG: DUF3575 domain-containing protein [Bacteroidales bacterium]